MKKQLQQITLFDAPAEAPAPVEKVTLSNTAPTPPRIVEIVEEEETLQTAIEATGDSPAEIIEEAGPVQTEEKLIVQETAHATTAPTPPAIIELSDEEEEESPVLETGEDPAPDTIEDVHSIQEEKMQTEPQPIVAGGIAPVPPRIIEIINEEEEQSREKKEDPVVASVSKVSFIETEQEPAEPLVNTVTQEEIIAETPPLPKRISSTRGRKSLKETAIAADLIQIPEDDILFSKQYYSIGEVATMFRENQSLIRYWETEFDILQPRKNRKGDRFFRPVDIKNLVLIYDLLRRRKFTIEGAKDFLKRNKKVEDKFAMIQSLEKIKSFLLELRTNL
ncbi:MerR family transcriptional regulator [Terrimonas sp. NA20]|uniref:MerR family transcriptional regulator n=1 Tax=Terrimonas ginsenosidimutans TaxID=2908004 RepID=A0ABS9KQ83_9BACT|nr:MerR family transcriptional regulator [Terrimonas ginsenosidimutans]MCG2614455.1 MerR family transcriptional regulator [Terrimonas ginsenosidimutans]